MAGGSVSYPYLDYPVTYNGFFVRIYWCSQWFDNYGDLPTKVCPRFVRSISIKIHHRDHTRHSD
jgi:hypothetical protein